MRHPRNTVMVLSAMRMGRYNSMESAYEAMLLWMTGHGRMMDGPPMKRYYSDSKKSRPRST